MVETFVINKDADLKQVIPRLYNMYMDIHDLTASKAQEKKAAFAPRY